MIFKVYYQTKTICLFGYILQKVIFLGKKNDRVFYYFFSYEKK